MTTESQRWESVDPNGMTQRLPVPGGWLYRFSAMHPCMVFVPDPDIYGQPTVLRALNARKPR